MFSLNFRHFAEMMFFTRRAENQQAEDERDAGPPEEKSHNALAH